MEEKGRVKNAWMVDFDAVTCSLCEICANDCPTRALFIRRDGSKLEILFDPRLCNGCRGEFYCEFRCPEKTLKMVRVGEEDLPDEPVVLVTGEMATCDDCGTPFMPERKLATLLEQEKITPKSVQDFCPDCRRNHLLENYMDMDDEP